MRAKGSAGGHNGLKSIEQELGTQDYARLRIGVGAAPREQSLESYVLGNFLSEEEKELPEVINRGAEALALWLSEGVEGAMRKLL